MPVDPTLDARKAAIKPKAKPKAKPKVANPLAAIKVWLKSVQEDLAKIKATQREATQRDGSLADIPAGVCTEFLTFMQDQVPTFVVARAAFQEVVDGDTPVDPYHRNGGWRCRNMSKRRTASSTPGGFSATVTSQPRKLKRKPRQRQKVHHCHRLRRCRQHPPPPPLRRGRHHPPGLTHQPAVRETWLWRTEFEKPGPKPLHAGAEPECRCVCFCLCDQGPRPNMQSALLAKKKKNVLCIVMVLFF